VEDIDGTVVRTAVEDEVFYVRVRLVSNRAEGVFDEIRLVV
jgi:hypothetical protein